MEAAFTHTRVLYEFLHREQGWEKRSPHEAVQSDLWSRYKTPLHEKVLHSSPRRPYVPGVMAGDDLQERAIDFAIDILELWRTVAAQLVMANYRAGMSDAAEIAIAEAKSTAAWFKTVPAFQ